MKQIVGLVAILFLLSSSPLQAQRDAPGTPEAALERLFTADVYPVEWFTTEFVDEVPPERLRVIVNTLVSTLGPYQRVETGGDGYEVVFQNGRVPTTIQLQADGRISTLLFRSPRVAEALTITSLERLFTTDTYPAEWFTGEFVAQVPPERLRAIVNTLVSTLGPYQRVEAIDDGYEVVFENARVPTVIRLDTQGRIETLLFQAPRSTGSEGASPGLAALLELPGQVSLLVTADGQARAAHHEDSALAVGSTFKLAVLAALRDQIDAGARAWADSVTLQPGWKSLPSGILQDWPDGTPLTLATLATLMIARSDNTATDALIATTGREAVEALSSRNRPLLTTREFFVLKDPANADLLARYRAGSEAERRAVLAETATRPLPRAEIFAEGPHALDVEWFFTAEELCRLVERVANLPLMTVNPGLARSQDWARVAFKGGSEPGVRNLTTWLEDAAGSRYCVAATWNADTTLDETRFDLAVGGLLASLR